MNNITQKLFLSQLGCLVSLAFLMLWLYTTPAKAQHSNQDWDSVALLEKAMSRKKHQSTYISLDRVYALDTYLSSSMYQGTGLRLEREVTSIVQRRQLSPGAVYIAPRVNQWTYNGGLAWLQHPAHTSVAYTGYLAVSYARLFQYRLSQVPLQVFWGPSVAGKVGINYHPDNGNNPIQLQALLRLGADVDLIYSFELFSRPWQVQASAFLPLVGAAFSPQFGQSYYEIFARGNYDHNLVLATPFQGLSGKARLMLSTQWKQHTFLLGFSGEWEQGRWNHLRNSYRFVGITLGYRRSFSIVPR